MYELIMKIAETQGLVAFLILLLAYKGTQKFNEELKPVFQAIARFEQFLTDHTESCKPQNHTKGE